MSSFQKLSSDRHADKQTGIQDAQLSQRDRAAACIIVFAKSKSLELEDDILRTVYRSIFNHCDIIGLKICWISVKKRKIRAITAFKVIQGHRGRYQSKARM